MIPKKPKREDCSSRNEYLTDCVIYERARAERAIEALKHYIDYGYDRSHAVKVLSEIQASEEE